MAIWQGRDPVGNATLLLPGHVVARSCLVGAQTKDLKGMSQVGVFLKQPLKRRRTKKLDFTTWNCQLVQLNSIGPVFGTLKAWQHCYW